MFSLSDGIRFCHVIFEFICDVILAVKSKMMNKCTVAKLVYFVKTECVGIALWKNKVSGQKVFAQSVYCATHTFKYSGFSISYVSFEILTQPRVY